MGKKKQLFRAKQPTGPRYRFNLPDDLREVRLAGFAQGLINATQQKKQGLQLSKEAIEAGAIESALLVEQEKKGGRQCCNDPVLFRKTFSEICIVSWQAVFTYWEKAPEVYNAFVRRPPQQQQANAAFMAEEYLDAVMIKMAAGEPVELR